MATARKPRITPAEYKRLVAESAKADQTEPRATAVRFDAPARSLNIAMRGGVAVTVPIDTLRGLEGDDDAELANVVLYGNGSEIHWPGLDYQVEITVLLSRLLGVTTVAENARRAGSVKSPAKAKASASNGAKGGRPRKVVA